MKKIHGAIILLFVTSIVAAQENAPTKLRVGLYVNGGFSSLMNMAGSGYGSMYGNTIMKYNFIGSVGGGVSLTVPLHPRWSFVSNLGYMNRGGNYGDTNSSSYNSLYRFSYIDVWASGQYNNLPKGPIKFIASWGLTASALISASDETSMGNQNMMDNVNQMDIGMVLGPGLEFGLKKKGAIQTRLLYTYGFMNVFGGMYHDSGMHSNNAGFLLQVGYIFN